MSLPGQVSAANFDNGGEGVAYHDTTAGNTGGAYRSTDVDIEASSEGGYDVGWIAAGEWVNYTVSVGAAGTYTAQLRLASPNGGSLHLGFNAASNVWQTVTVPATGGWQTWTTINVPVTLGAGTQQITLLFDTGGFNISYIKVASGSTTSTSTITTASTTTSNTTASSSSTGAFSGTPVSLPGKVPAANFDNGGAGIAYYDTTSGNSGGAYRSTDVDIEPSSEGGYDIGWIAAGEWLNYTVNVGAAGSYTAQLRVASPNGGGSLHIGFNGPSNVWTAVSIPATGGWQTWTTVNVPVTLGAGTQQMTLLVDAPGFNISYVSVVSGSTSTLTASVSSTSTSTSSTSSATVTIADWNIQVDDSSTTHAQVAMDLLMSIGPRPQIIVIQEARQSQYNTYLSELQAQTGQQWYGAFHTHCPSNAWNGSTCTGTEDEGVGVFTSFPIVSSDFLWLPYADAYHSARASVRAAINVNGVVTQVFAVHLQPNNATARYESMALWKPWAANYSTPQFAAGDFNAGSDQIDISSGMSSAFADAWSLAGSGSNFTAFLPSPNMKIDFSFVDLSGKAQVQSTWVPTSTGSWSDHMPVVTTLTVHQ